MSKSINQDSMRDLNLKLMLQTLFNNPQTTRIDISNQLKLNKSTITSLYNALYEADYIREIGQGTSSGAGGRRPILIKFNQRFGYSINFELGHHHLRMMVNWSNGEKISFSSIPVINASIHDVVQNMKERIRNTKIPEADHGLLGISIAINGIVDDNTIIDSPFIDMKDVDLVSALSEFQVPVLLENEANLSAIAVRDFITHGKKHNIMALDVHNGIGAGIIINNKLYRGRYGQAGEIGRSFFYKDTLTNSTRPIEQSFSEDAIINELKDLKGLSHLDRELFLQYYRADDPQAKELMTKFLNALGFIIYNVDQGFSPDIIYLQSRIVGEIPSLLDVIIQQYIKLKPNNHLAIKLSPMVEAAPLYGGASLVIHKVLDLMNYDLRFTF